MVDRKRRYVKVVLGLLGVAVVVGACGGAVTYSKEFSGTVINSASGDPIDGAVVVATWELQAFETSSLMNFVVKEAVTDSAGSFSIPAWGPKFNKRFLYTNIRGDDPALIVLKNGFLPEFPRNYGQQPWITPVILSADRLDGQTIELTPRSGPMEDYIDALQADVEMRIQWSLLSKGCDWQKIPHLLEELHAAGEDGIESGVDGRSLMIGRIPPRECGDPRAYFEGRLQ